MRRDDHTHTLEIEIAEKADILEGTSQTKFVVPASLGTASAFDSDFFATAEQGRKIDEVHARLNDAHTKATEAKQASDDVVKTAREAKTAADQAVTAANEAKDAVENQKADILLNKKAIQDLKSRRVKVTLEDLSIAGDRDGDHVLSGTGWIPKQAELSAEDREKIAKIEEIEESVQLLRDCCQARPEPVRVDLGLQDRVEAVEQKAEKNESDIGEIKEKAEEARQKAIEADAKIAALEVLSTDEGKAKQALDLIQGKLTAAETASQQARDVCNEAKAISEQNKARVESVTDKVNEFEGKVDDAISKSTRAEATAAAANARALEASNHASEAKTAAEQAEGKIREVSTKVDGFEQRIEEVKQCCDQPRPAGDLEEIKTSVDQAKAIANAAQTAARNANSAITAAGVNAENALKKSTDAENKVQELDGKIKQCCDDFEETKADLESKIDHNKDEIAAVKTTAESARTAADASKAITDGLAPRVTAVEGKATTLEGKITEVEGKVTAVEGRVDELEKKPAGGGNVDFYTANKMDDQSEFEKLIEANHAKVQAVRAQVGLQPHATAGIDDDERWTVVEGYKNKPTAWIKDLKDLAVQVTDATVHTLYHQKRLGYLEDVINMANVTALSHHKHFLQAKKDDRRRLIIKAGTLLSFYITQKKGHIVFNKDHEISHGVGAGQAPLQAGRDYYVLALVDWDSPTREVTFSIQWTTAPPAGYNAGNTLVIGGFHTLCADVGVLAGHPLSGFRAGDILPDSVWCLNHRPKCSPEGMVYHGGRDFWSDIYLTSVSAPHGVTARSRFQGAVSVLSRNEFTSKLINAGKRLPTDEEFTCLVDGTPSSTRMGAKASSAGGHKGTNGKRIISRIGVEDGFGVYSTFLSNVCTVYNPNAVGGARHEMRGFAAGGSYALVYAGISHRNGGLAIASRVDLVAARGVCEPRRV